MRALIKIILFLTVLILTAACSSTSWKKRTLYNMGIGLAAGYIAGSSVAPKNESHHAHGVMYGAIAASAIAATSIYNYDEDSVLRNKNKEILKLNELVESGRTTNRTLINQKSFHDLTNKEIPSDLKPLIRVGKWRYYKISEWSKEPDGSFVHKNRLLEFEPATINQNLIREE